MELLTNQQMGLADQLTISAGAGNAHSNVDDNEFDAHQVTEFDLLCNAGREVAQHILSHYPNHRRALVLCGPGNNGGDGYIAAKVLLENGYSVHVVAVGPATTSLIVKQAQQFWGGSIAQSGAVASKLSGPDLTNPDLTYIDLVVDAMFGAGLSRELQDDAAAWVQLLNERTRQTSTDASVPAVVAVDVPSGLNADSGAPIGVALQATSTITFFRLKPGHILCPGRELCGDVELVDIGIDPSVLQALQPSCYLNMPALWHNKLPGASVSQHKFHRGHTLVYSGPMHATGAARLSARAALRAGSGLVTLATPEDAIAVVAAQVTAVMIAPWKNTDDAIGLLSDARINSVLIGPAFGVGSSTCELVLALLHRSATTDCQLHNHGQPVFVLDADALSSFSDRRQDLFDAIVTSDTEVVLTPHDGEYGRLFDYRGSRLERARLASAKSGATVVLKGPDTVVASPDGRASINNNAPPTLATAGSGDVLAGMIAALMAQGVEAFTAASAAVWMHGECASTFGVGLIAEDIPEQLPHVLSQLLQWK